MSSDQHQDHTSRSAAPFESESKHPSTKKHKKNEKVDWSTQGALVMGGALAIIIIIIVVIGVTQNTDKPPRTVTDASLLPETVKYGGETLPGAVFVGMEATRSETDPALVAEIQKVIADKTMPSDIFHDDVPAEKNIATELNRSFSLYRTNPDELNVLREKIPRGGEWQIPAADLDAVQPTLERLEPKRQSIREKLLQEDVCFSFEFLHPENQEAVPTGDSADFLSDYLLLEEFAIAKALRNGDMDEAITSLSFVFRLAQLAAEVPSPSIRMRAAECRIRAIDILQTLLQNTHCQGPHAQRTLGMLQEQLDAWTPESVAWKGDRASGMKVFNLVRQYGLLGALEPDEIDELIERGLIQTREIKEGPNKGEEREVGDKLRDDEIYYLKTMTTLIAACDEPFFKRTAVLQNIEKERQAWYDTSEEKTVSELLLRFFSQSMERFALDRAKCEMAVVALTTSLNRQMQVGVNPLSGDKYDVHRIQDTTENGSRRMVVVSFTGNVHPFRIPDFTQQPQQP